MQHELHHNMIHDYLFLFFLLIFHLYEMMLDAELMAFLLFGFHARMGSRSGLRTRYRNTYFPFMRIEVFEYKLES